MIIDLGPHWDESDKDPVSGRCDECSSQKLVKLIADPFEEEVKDRIVMRDLCRECYQELLEDV
jgi:hypothetical protein